MRLPNVQNNLKNSGNCFDALEENAICKTFVNLSTTILLNNWNNFQKGKWS